jgi:hypothetical protein
MKYLDSSLKYIDRTGRTFKRRCKEHIEATRNNNGNSEYSNHILNTGHSCRTISDTMDIIIYGEKRQTT